MPVHYEIHDSNSKFPGGQLFRQYAREEDAIQAVHGLGFPGVYHVIKVTTESELVYHAEIEETEEWREEMRQLRAKVHGFHVSYSTDPPGENE